MAELPFVQSTEVKRIGPLSQKAAAKVRSNALALIKVKVEEDDMAVVMAAKRANEIDSVEAGMDLLMLNDAELMAEGWSRTDLRIAIDAKQSGKDVPYYVKMNHERVIAKWRGEEDNHPSSAARVVMPVQVNITQGQRDAAPIINIGDGK